jgi:hypothetical protein
MRLFRCPMLAQKLQQRRGKHQNRDLLQTAKSEQVFKNSLHSR